MCYLCSVGRCAHALTTGTYDGTCRLVGFSLMAIAATVGALSTVTARDCRNWRNYIVDDPYAPGIPSSACPVLS